MTMEFADIIRGSPADANTSIWYMNSDGTHTYKIITTEKNGFSEIKSAANSNNDGIVDILWENTVDSTESI